MQQTKVKVSRDKLLEAVRARREKTIAEHEQAMTKWEKQQAGVQSRIVAALKKALKDAEGGKLPEQRGTSNILVPMEQPGDAFEPTLNTTHIDRLIKTLEIGVDDSISISAWDAAEYLG